MMTNALLVLIFACMIGLLVLGLAILHDLDTIIYDAHMASSNSTKISTNVMKSYMASRIFIKKHYGLDVDALFDAYVEEILEKRRQMEKENEELEDDFDD